ncbi:MAG TPA: sigma-54 dependent transcriptional regulator, partial [Pyrinomonadaceae bacterium]|nr:sigma-54 dependent transcriptional regulator [Pyrinomonadaceae bacterium]
AKAIEHRQLRHEIEYLRHTQQDIYDFDRIVGASGALQSVLSVVKKVAKSNTTVLIRGETGTGKELIAGAIHHNSLRTSRNFVKVNCAALQENLLESELFGHEKGAFTSADKMRKGRFELAHGGTLFLDEISELTQAVQVKLLRVLQERAFERVGGDKTIEVDIRLIAACNRDLEKDVESGRFRRDLFFRLNVVPLVLPPLRQRQEDIPLLAAHFVAKAAEKHGRTPQPELDPELIEALVEYDWPGNVRELENIIERLVVLTTAPRLGVEFLPETMQRTLPKQAALGDETTLEGATAALKRRMIAAALKSEGGNKVAAARRLGISRSYLHRLISELEIAEPETQALRK